MGHNPVLPRQLWSHFAPTGVQPNTLLATAHDCLWSRFFDTTRKCTNLSIKWVYNTLPSIAWIWIVNSTKTFLQNFKIITKLDTKHSDTPSYHTAMFTICKTTSPDTLFSRLAPGLIKTAQMPVLLKSRFAPCPILPRIPPMADQGFAKLRSGEWRRRKIRRMKKSRKAELNMIASSVKHSWQL